jgi:hypothetical protein
MMTTRTDLASVERLMRNKGRTRRRKKSRRVIIDTADGVKTCSSEGMRM